MNKKVYIGDSVYAQIVSHSFLGFELILTTENGYADDPRNRIVIGPSEWESLLDVMEILKEKQPDGESDE